MRSIAVPLHEEDLSLIDESVDDGMCNGIVSKDLVELSERQVGGRNGPNSASYRALITWKNKLLGRIKIRVPLPEEEKDHSPAAAPAVETA
jgi:hypothetical protein